MEGLEGRLVGAIAIRNKPNQKREQMKIPEMHSGNRLRIVAGRRPIWTAAGPRPPWPWQLFFSFRGRTWAEKKKVDLDGGRESHVSMGR
jgi:hypothetical protein